MYNTIGALFLIGIVIKLMDDFLDQDLDNIVSNKNFTEILGRGILPYALILLIFALALDYNNSITFFSASYIVGMGYNSKQRLPSFLYAWQESIIVFLIIFLITSFYETISALVLIIIIQLIDDFLDYRKDKRTANSNLVKKIGYIPAIIMTSIFFVIAIKFFPLKLTYFITAAFLVYLVTDIFFK